MKIYIAAPWAEKAGLAKLAKDRFVAAGFDVISSWVDRDVGNPPYSDALMRSEATNDVAEVKASNALVLINSQTHGEETSGKAVETGLALANGITVVLVGARTNVFHYLPEILTVDTIDEAIAVLKETRE